MPFQPNTLGANPHGGCGVRSWVCDGARARNGKWEGLNPSPPVTVSPSGSAGAHSVSVMEA